MCLLRPRNFVTQIDHVYFHRHIDIDDTRHGPLAKKMLKVITKTKVNENKAYESGLKSLELRYKLWDELHKKMK